MATNHLKMGAQPTPQNVEYIKHISDNGKGTT
jgi:hypothetical protein